MANPGEGILTVRSEAGSQDQGIVPDREQARPQGRGRGTCIVELSQRLLLLRGIRNESY